MRTATALILIAALVSVFPVASVAAEQDGRISGTATGANQAAQSNTTVRLRNVNTGALVAQTTTNAMGEYEFTALDNGDYVVEIVDASGNIIGTSPTITISDDDDTAAGVAIGAAGGAAAAAAVGGGVGGFFASTAGIVTALAGGAAGVAGGAAAAGAFQNKVLVCHVTGASPRTLEINKNALAEHLGHEDKEGACPASSVG